MKFRGKMCDIFSIQHLYRILHTVAKMSDKTRCIVRITPERLYISTKPGLMGGGWFLATEIRPDQLFDEFLMAGYSDEANEIYLEVKADIFMQSLRTPSQSAKFVRIKLTGKAGPCLSVEAELPSQAPSCRKTLFDVPVMIVHRSLWSECTPAEDVSFNTSCWLPVFKVFKGVIDHMKCLGNHVEIAINQVGEMKLHVGEAVDGFSVHSHFRELEISSDSHDDSLQAPQDLDEEEDAILSSNGFFKVTVDVKHLASFLTALQFQNTQIRCDIRHRQHIQFTTGSEGFRIRYFIPSVDVQH